MYICILKDLMISLNQDLSIDENLLQRMYKKKAETEQNRANWTTIKSELEKIGLYIDDQDTMEAYIAGKVDTILTLFRRIDRFVKMITYDANVLDLSNYRAKVPVKSNIPAMFLLNFLNANAAAPGKPSPSRRSQPSKQS